MYIYIRTCTCAYITQTLKKQNTTHFSYTSSGIQTHCITHPRLLLYDQLLKCGPPVVPPQSVFCVISSTLYLQHEACVTSICTPTYGRCHNTVSKSDCLFTVWTQQALQCSCVEITKAKQSISYTCTCVWYASQSCIVTECGFCKVQVFMCVQAYVVMQCVFLLRNLCENCSHMCTYVCVFCMLHV